MGAARVPTTPRSESMIELLKGAIVALTAARTVLY